jgi:hypothetical protein
MGKHAMLRHCGEWGRMTRDGIFASLFGHYSVLFFSMSSVSCSVVISTA